MDKRLYANLSNPYYHIVEDEINALLTILKEVEPKKL